MNLAGRNSPYRLRRLRPAPWRRGRHRASAATAGANRTCLAGEISPADREYLHDWLARFAGRGPAAAVLGPAAHVLESRLPAGLVHDLVVPVPGKDPGIASHCGAHLVAAVSRRVGAEYRGQEAAGLLQARADLPRPDGMVRPELQSPRNDVAEAWGLELYRSAVYAFVAAL